jgi:hypothetical protein
VKAREGYKSKLFSFEKNHPKILMCLSFFGLC